MPQNYLCGIDQGDRSRVDEAECDTAVINLLLNEVECGPDHVADHVETKQRRAIPERDRDVLVDGSKMWTCKFDLKR